MLRTRIRGGERGAARRGSLAPWLGVLVSFALCLAVTCEAGAAAGERQIKSAFVYNFVKFVEWPAARDEELILIGVLGDDDFAAELALTVRNRQVSGRALLVRRLRTLEDAAQLHVVFVAAPAQAKFSVLKEVLADAPVLTVGEAPSFAGEGGAIGLVRDGDRLRFEINVSAAARARLRISSELQKLALSVHKGP